MAETNNADSPNHCTQQLPKDLQGSDNFIPLSPQWLLAKPEKNKIGTVTADSELGPYSGYITHSDYSKSPHNGMNNNHNTEKKSDVFRPSLQDREFGHHDRWGDEERETTSALRGDRWREGVKYLGNTRMMERGMDNSRTSSGEPQCGLYGRWSDSSSRASKYEQRRESKWNTRWGLNDKDSTYLHEKLLDTNRIFDVPQDKELPPLNNPVKENKKGDHYRPRRLETYHSRGKGEPHKTLTPKKEISSFGNGRSHAEDAPLTFNHERVSSAGNLMQTTPSSTTAVYKVEGHLAEYSPLRYSRTQLLDLYKMNSLTSPRQPLDGLIDLPSLIQEEFLEPLALSPPGPEELAILKDIENGDAVSSGVPQVTNDESVGRNSTNLMHSRQNKLENSPYAINRYKDKNLGGVHYIEGPSNKKCGFQYGFDPKLEAVPHNQSFHTNAINVEASRANGVLHKKSNKFTIIGEVTEQRKSPAFSGTSWRPQTLEQSHLPLQETGPRMPDMGWSQSQLDRDTKEKVSEGFSSDLTSDCTAKRQPSDVLETERDAKKCLPHSSPQDLSLYYKDPEGQIQGPFSGSDLIGWFEAGFFGIDLQVRFEGASCDTPFSSLGDVIPQLRAKATPPPGFDGPKKLEPVETRGSKFSDLGKFLSSSNETDILLNELRNGQESLRGAENMILESIVAGDLGSSRLEKLTAFEALRAYIESNSVGEMPTLVGEGNDVNFLLALKLLLERLKSSPNLRLQADSPFQISHPQISTLHANLEKSLAVSLGISGLSCFPGQGVIGTSQDMMDTDKNQLVHSLTRYGIQQQMLQSQNPPSLANQMGGSVDDLSSVATTEKLLLSVLSQDPNILKMLQEQQQQLLLEKQQQLLQQQQQQLVQQQQILLQQQILRQQEECKILQVLHNDRSCPSISEQSSGHVRTVSKAPGRFPIDKQVSGAPHEMFQSSSQVPSHTSVNSLGLQAPHEMFRANSQVPAHASQDAFTAGIALLHSQVPTDVGCVASSKISALDFPRQVSENITDRDVSDASPMKQTRDVQHKNLLVPPAFANGLLSPETMKKSSQGTSILNMHDLVANTYVPEVEAHIQNTSGSAKMVSVITAEGAPCLHPQNPASSGHLGIKKNGVPIFKQFSNVKVSSTDTSEESRQLNEKFASELVLAKEAKGAEVRDSEKVSEKKSKQRNNPKAQISEQLKVMDNAISQSKQSEKEGINVLEKIFETDTFSKNVDTKLGMKGTGTVVLEQDGSSLERNISNSVVETTQGMGKLREDEPLLLQNSAIHSGQRVWKPAPGLKAKSLLEIQQEEQCRIETDLKVSEFGKHAHSSSPWTGAIPSLELNSYSNNHQAAGGTGINLGNSENAKNMSNRSHLHDLLAEEVLLKSGDIVGAHDNVSILSLQQHATRNDSSVDDADLTKAKDTKRSRKKSGKGSVVGVKAATPSSADVSISCPTVKVKDPHQKPDELSGLPSDPNSGDFVPWKGELGNQLPPPVWSTDSGKLYKPTSLRDIQKEQEQKAPFVQQTAPMSTSKTVHSNQGTRGSGPTRSGPTQSLSGSSPYKAASLVQANALVLPQSKSRVEDDLFWGPFDQSNGEGTHSVLSRPASLRDIQKEQEEKTLAQQTTYMPTSKRVHSNHRTSGSGATQSLAKSSPSKATSLVLVDAPASAKSRSGEDDLFWGPLGESNEETMQQEKDNTTVKGTLTGLPTRQKSLSNMSAGNTRSLTSIAQSSQKGTKAAATQHSNTSLLEVPGLGDCAISTETMSIGNVNGIEVSCNDGVKGGGKKKGKKGKKLSASVLGFNVVSNRIMMGEIQAVED